MIRSEHLKTKNYPGLVIEKMQGKPWQKIMDLGLKILNEYQFDCQPGSGTLLGLVREDDGYIHYDTDIDIDVIEQEKNKDSFDERLTGMVKSFKENGFTVARTQFYTWRPSQIAFIHTKTKLIYDLCFFYDAWGTDFINVYEHGIFLRPPYSVLETTSLKFNGSTYTVPKDVDRYLTGRYGEWKVPTHAKQSGEKDAANYLILL